MGIKFIDLAETTLAANLASNGLTATVITGDGALFPALTGGDYYIAAIVSAGGAYEFVKITAVSGDSLTIVRAQDGTTALGFSAGGKIRVVNNATWLNATELSLSGKLTNGESVLVRKINAVGLIDGYCTFLDETPFLPDLNNSGYLQATLYQPQTGAYEFVKVTDLQAPGGTPIALLTRGQFGTVAQTFSSGALFVYGGGKEFIDYLAHQIELKANATDVAAKLANGEFGVVRKIAVTDSNFGSTTFLDTTGFLPDLNFVGYFIAALYQPQTGAYEFVKVTDLQAPGGTPIALITRAQFGTTAQNFTSGAVFVYGGGSPFLDYLAHQIELKATLASPTFTGTVGGITKSMVGLGSVDNTSDANKPVSSATQTAINASSVRNLDNGGDAITADSICIQTGRGNTANVTKGNFSVAIGYDTATEAGSVFQFAIGYKAKPKGNYSMAFGAHTVTNGAHHIAFNNDGWDRISPNTHVFQSPYNMIENTGFQNWWYGEEHNWYCNLTGYRTEVLDLTGGTTWVTATAYKHSYFVKPTTPNGYYYTRYDNSYPFDDAVTYTPSTGGAVEPTWTTTALASVTDDSNNGDWICIDLANYEQAFADRMLITEIGFLCYELDSITVGATISIGTQANGTLFCSGQTINPSAAWQMVNIPITANAVMDLKFNITALATGVKMRGCFFVKGMYVKDI